MRHRFLSLCFLLLAAFFRLYGFVSFSPPGLTHDEVANWLIVQDILAGKHAIYFTRAYGHEAGFHYVQAAFVALLGDNALALRLPAAFFGLLLVAVVYALGRELFGRQVGVWGMGLTAVLFPAIFFSRLAFRAISLPVLAGLSAVFWWRGWDRRGAAEQGRRGASSAFVRVRPRPIASFALAGVLAGLSVHTYMAARAVPIFYGVWVGYLALFHWPELKQRWRGVVLFWLLFVVIVAPLFVYLQTNPGSEFRIAEVDAPLRALMAGNVVPVLQNGVKILGMAGFAGDPLWRQNVAGRPLFDPFLATIFYISLPLFLWKIRDKRHAFLLLWLATAVLPSLVTINAPSSIRMINILPILPLFIGVVIHNRHKLSPVIPNLSTVFVNILGIVVLGYHIWWTAVSVFQIWPQNEEVRFVWQAGLTQTAVFLDHQPTAHTAAIAGWSPDTMDVPTMQLTLQRDDIALSHFNPLDGTLVLPAANGAIYRPTILDLHPYWQTQLASWGAVEQQHGEFVEIRLPDGFVPEVEEGEKTAVTDTDVIPANAGIQLTPQVTGKTAVFANQLQFLGYDLVGTQELVTYWRVLATPTAASRLFVHQLDVAGNVLGEDYRLDALDPQAIWFPHWQPGDLILQHHDLPVPLADTATLRLGWFNPYTCTVGPCQNWLTEAGEPFLLLAIGD